VLSIDKKLLIYLLILILPCKIIGKEEKFEYHFIKIENDSLVFNFEVKNIFAEPVVEGLNKGMTTVLEYKIQLWKKRSLWIDKLVAEDILRFKINFDIWSKRYIVFKNKEKPGAFDINEVKEKCQKLPHYSLCSCKDLENNKEYKIAIKVTLHPISIENYKEIQRWIVGEAKEIDTEVIKQPKKAGKKAGNWVLGLVLNLSGFGDQVINARSQSFSINSHQLIFVKE